MKGPTKNDVCIPQKDLVAGSPHLTETKYDLNEVSDLFKRSMNIQSSTTSILQASKASTSTVFEIKIPRTSRKSELNNEGDFNRCQSEDITWPKLKAPPRKTKSFSKQPG